MSTTSPTPRPPLTPAALDALLLETTPYLSCDDCFEEMDIYVEAILSDPAHEDPAMAAHLRGCPACAEEAETLADLVEGRRG
jgi:hypothetical protein